MDAEKALACGLFAVGLAPLWMPELYRVFEAAQKEQTHPDAPLRDKGIASPNNEESSPLSPQ